VPLENMNAYDLLLKGRALLTKPDRGTNSEARALFEQALKLDDRYAAAYAALGWTYYIEASAGWTEFTGDSLDKAAELGTKAAALDPNLAQAHQLLGFVYLARREYQRAKDHTERALELNPSDPYSYATYGGILLWLGDAKGTIKAMETAVKFDPHLDWEFLYVLGFGYFLDQRYGDAARVLEPISDASSDDYSVWLGLAATYAQQGRNDDAKRAAANVLRKWPFFRVQPFVDQLTDPKAQQFMADSLRKAGLT
jgi:adenylate cyclase